MKTIERLRQLRGKAVERMNALAKAASDEKRELTAAETAEFDARKSEVSELDEAIAEALELERSAADAESLRSEQAKLKSHNSIKARVKQAGLDEKFAQSLVDRPNITEQAASDAIFAELAARRESEPESRSHRADVTRDERQTRIENMSAALLHRYSPGKFKADDAAVRPYRNMTLLRMAEECLALAGQKPRGMSSMEVATRALAFNGSGTVIGVPSVEEFGAMSTSDFPFILANVANKTLRAAYDVEPQTWRPFCRQANATDFKAKYVNQLGDAPSLELVPENGEFKYGMIPEARESYRLYTYGKILPLTRQAIINDEMSAFTRVPELQGRAVARLENDLIWDQITGNPTMGDSVALFDAAHGNLVNPGTAISVDNLGIARALMRVQKGLSSVEVLNLMPRFLLAPAAKETLALQYTSAAFVAALASSQNPYAGTMTPIIEPRLDANSGTAWYLVADPNQVDTIEYAYLEGQEGAYYETRMGFNVDGIELKVRHDFGRKVIDHRAFVKNLGA